MAITLRPITEDNFIDAFNLKLKDGQERFVAAMKWWATSWSYTITTFPNTTYGT